MKLSLPTPQSEIPTVAQGEESNLINLLCNEKSRCFLGRGLALRIEVLAQLQAHSRSLYSIAKEYGVSRQAVSKIRKRALSIYG